MNGRRMFIGILALVLLLALAGSALQAQRPQRPDESQPVDEIDAVHDAVPIQGRLTDASGNPLDGSYDIRARIYDVSTGGTTLCNDTDPITVDNGLFNMYLDGPEGCSASDIDGKQLYLGITVGSDAEMYPRQGIYPVPYAWSLRPGAIIRDTTNTILFSVENDGAGTAIVGECEDGYGVYGSSTSWYGVTGTSVSGRGVRGVTNRGDNNYGLYTADNLYSLNFHSKGAQMEVVQNGGQAALEPGDVVIFSGLAAGDPPVIQVAQATSANSTAVAGVVYSRYNVAAVAEDPEQSAQGEREVTLAGPVPPGEYLLMVIQGPAQVKASDLAGAIQPGDLLSSAGPAGQAAKAVQVSIEGVQTAVPGTVFGKALEPLDQGDKMIYVFVTLQ